jgi:hypothetical protein
VDCVCAAIAGGRCGAVGWFIGGERRVLIGGEGGAADRWLEAAWAVGAISNGRPRCARDADR